MQEREPNKPMVSRGEYAARVGKTDARCSPRSKRNLQRVTALTAIVAACGVTVDCLPASGHSWRPLMAAEIAAAWAAVAAALLVGLRNQRRADTAMSDMAVSEDL